MTSLKLFHHTSLQSPRSIRLCSLSPAPGLTTPLEVTLLESSLDSAAAYRNYEALSYVWGTREGTCPIICNGERLLITPNCDSALRHLRRTDQSRVLWVDSICIDQRRTAQALVERNTQVPLMGEIYAKADRTLCWLGEGLSYTDDVVRLLERIGRCPSMRGLRKLMDFEKELQSKNLLDNESSCLDHIFCHPWHTRVWTVQEVALASECLMICGGSAISWDLYATAATFLIYDQFVPTLDIHAAKSMVGVDMRNVFRGYLQADRIEDQELDTDEDRRIVYLTSCLTDISQLRATEPKDKIYGLYAIYTKLGIGLPTVDYNTSLVDVYTEAALAVIAWSGSLKLLADACGTARNKGLATWVPDRNDEEARLFMPDSEATERSRIQDTRRHILYPAVGKLFVRGLIIGEVNEESIPLMQFPTRNSEQGLPILSSAASYRYLSDVDFLRLLVDQIRFYRSLLHALTTSSDQCNQTDTLELFEDIITTGERNIERNVLNAWIELLRYPECHYNLSIAALLAEDWKGSDATHAKNWTAEIYCCVTIAAALTSNSILYDHEPHPLTDAMSEFIKDVASNLADKSVVSVYLESSGTTTLGTTFRSVIVGDVAVLLEGADWPVILRPKASEWVLIGPAFIVGVMDGEAWPDGNDDGSASGLREFVLV